MTTGAYRPEDVYTLQHVIDARLEPAVSDPKRRGRFYKGLTVCFGGKAGTNLRGSLMYLYGHEGGGKGNTAGVTHDAFGGYCMSLNVRALLATSEIQDGLANMLERNPRLVTVSEATRLPMDKLLSITGRDMQSARGPHKVTIERKLIAGMMVTAVDVPEGRMDTGAKRRLLAIRFDSKANVTNATARDDTTQEECDALVTVVLCDALTMWQDPENWEPLPDDDDDTSKARRAADPVEDFLDGLTDADEGARVADLLSKLQTIGGGEVAKMNARALSTRIKKREDWTVQRRRWHQEKHKTARIVRPGRAGPDAD